MAVASDEVAAYFHLCMTDETPIDGAVEFWRARSAQWPVLASLANEYLSIPASSAEIERVWSTAGMETRGLKNRTQERLLNAKLLTRQNADFI